MPEIAPYGSWRSPITASSLVESAVSLTMPLAGDDAVYWIEGRASEQGRQVVVRRDFATGRTEDVFGKGFNARTTVHEYGGLSYCPAGETVYFSNFADQRLYKVAPGTEPTPITSEPPAPRSVRFAAPLVSPDNKSLLVVRERHLEPDVPSEVVNEIVAVPTDGSGEVSVLLSGHDFFSQVAVSPDGRRIAWVSWDHPDMPWDETELWEAELGPGPSIARPRLVAGGRSESAIQPLYAPDGRLHFISDRTGWWNLYEDSRGDVARAVAPMESDLGEPAWLLGRNSYTFLADGSIVAYWSARGFHRLGILHPGDDGFTELETRYCVFNGLRTAPGGQSVLTVAGSGSAPLAVVTIEADRAGRATTAVLQENDDLAVDSSYVSVPQAIEFPTTGGRTAHGLYYPPCNPEFEAPDGELPPLIVESHGGPTSCTFPLLKSTTQFWTTRGFAVVDVNYGGSTGYGREYRDRLRHNWGIVDLDDCVNAALHLADTGRAERSRLLIHGKSAGGYTTLCALTFRDVFAAGASHFGVADISALARETHKFESRYLDSLVGPWPESEPVYRERSPIFHTDRLHTPMILFQGLEDKVVPPSQAEQMAAALREKGVPYAYLSYEGEQHGFRKAENVKRTAEAELYFYGKVLGFEPADDIEPVEIINEENLSH